MPDQNARLKSDLEEIARLFSDLINGLEKRKPAHTAK
jgi:hypothetical protein